MRRGYTVSYDDKSERWYAHMVGFPTIPVWGSFGTKRHALQWAGWSMGMNYSDYMEWRKKNDH